MSNMQLFIEVFKNYDIVSCTSCRFPNDSLNYIMYRFQQFHSNIPSLMSFLCSHHHYDKDSSKDVYHTLNIECIL